MNTAVQGKLQITHPLLELNSRIIHNKVMEGLNSHQTQSAEVEPPVDTVANTPAIKKLFVVATAAGVALGVYFALTAIQGKWLRNVKALEGARGHGIRGGIGAAAGVAVIGAGYLVKSQKSRPFHVNELDPQTQERCRSYLAKIKELREVQSLYLEWFEDLQGANSGGSHQATDSETLGTSPEPHPKDGFSNADLSDLKRQHDDICRSIEELNDRAHQKIYQLAGGNFSTQLPSVIRQYSVILEKYMEATDLV